MCYSYASLCGHVRQPGSLDSCGHYARRTLMAPLPVAVQSGPFVWKWVYIHLLPNDSPSSPRWAYCSYTHTHTHTDWAEATNMHQRAFRWCNAPSVGHVGGIWWLWTACYASTSQTFAPLVRFNDFGFIMFCFHLIKFVFRFGFMRQLLQKLHELISHDKACLHWLPIPIHLQAFMPKIHLRSCNKTA